MDNHHHRHRNSLSSAASPVLALFAEILILRSCLLTLKGGIMVVKLHILNQSPHGVGQPCPNSLKVSNEIISY